MTHRVVEQLAALVSECEQYRGFSVDAGLLVDARKAISAVTDMCDALALITVRLELAEKELPGTFPGKAIVPDLRAAVDNAKGE